MKLAAMHRVVGLLERLPSGMADAIWLWLVLRLGLGILAALLFISGGLPTPCDSDIATNGWTTFPPLADGPITFPLIGVWQHWDACWYTKIAAFGYEPGVSSTAFFPLLPLLMRAGSIVVGDIVLAGLVVSAVALVVGLTGLRQLIERDFGAEIAGRTQLYVAIFPVAFFFFAPFTESLFLACAIWAILGARRGDWELAGVAAFLAALTRPHGILLAIPLLWEAVRWLIAQAADPESGRWRFGRRQVAPLAAAVAPVLAALLYYWFTAVIVGRSLVEAQSTWGGGNSRLPWETVAAAWDRVISSADMVTALNLVALLLFSVLFLAGLRRVPVSYSLYVLPQLVLLAIRAPTWPLMSGARFMAVLFPCFVVLAMLGRYRRLHTAWVLLSLILLGFFTTKFLEGRFIG